MKYSLLFLFYCSLATAQVQINGIIKDAQTKKPVSFSSINTNDGQHYIADGNGKFQLTFKPTTTAMSATFVGFEKKRVSLFKSKTFYLIWLNPKKNQSQLEGSNPLANQLIEKTVQNIRQNDPLKKLNSFQFKRYTKLIVTANPDSILGKIDSVFKQKKGVKTFKKIDSADFKFKKIITQHHLFETEKVSEFQFKNNVFKETVLGIKVAGLKEPIYELMGFNLQSFSIYDSNYELMSSKYDSPISKKSEKKYSFQILDSTEIDHRKVIEIYFENKNPKITNSLQGVLYIDVQNFAIAQAVMRTKGVLEVSGIHYFDYFESQRMWFPSKKTFKISKGKNNEDIKILGGTIEFSDDKENALPHKTASDFTYLLSESINSDFKFETDFEIKKKYISIDVKNDAFAKDASFWTRNRVDSLDVRSKKTYNLLDSISILNKIEKRLFLGRKVIKGFVPYQFLDMDLRTILSFNNYEGFRMGIGGTTNEKLSKIFRADGYTAYGSKDETLKYHAGLGIRVGDFSNSWLGVSYTNDLSEIATTTFLTDNKLFKIYTSQPVSVNTFYNYKSISGYLETRIIPKTFSVWQLSQSKITPQFDYGYLFNQKLYTNYTLTAASFSFQWNPNSTFMQTPRGKLEIEKKYPKLTLQFAQTIPKLLNNDFVFFKIDFRADWQKKYLNSQKTALLFLTGIEFGDIPITHLYSTSPNSLLNESVFRRFLSIITDNSFETMYFNEFFSDRYVYLQGIHSFKRIKFNKHFGISLAFVHRMAWGNLKKQERHLGLDFKTLDQGYYESGLEFNQIFKGLGIGSFYRYGPNELPGFYNNFAIKASFVFDLGF